MSPGIHLIRQATVEVFADGVDAFHWQQEVAGWTHHGLIPMLEAAFESLPESESLICIDRLEITVTAQDFARWGDSALNQVRTEVSQRLYAHGLAEPSHGTVKHKGEISTHGDRLTTEARAEDATDSDTEVILDPLIAFVRRWSQYLLHGALPWNLYASSRSAWDGQIEKALTDLDSRSESVIHSFGMELSRVWKYAGARKRFLALPHRLIESILQRLFGLESNLVESWKRDAKRLIGETSLKGDLGDEILLALAHHPRLFKHGLGDEIVQTYVHRAFMAGHIPRFTSSPPSTNLNMESEAFREAAKHLLASHAMQGTPTSIQARDKTSSLAQPTELTLARPSVNQDLDRNIESDSSAFWKAGNYIDHAGLVLTAPFLTTLFERLGVWNPVASTVANTQPSLSNPALALTLLHYLATGSENAVEFQLPMAKVLCGLPIESACDLPYVLSSDQCSEADAALESLIAHWSALKDTSIDGLREAFLQRPGKLILRDKDWFLQVEQRPFDMLLQQLPWSLQFIRLPWMSQFVRTEWME